LASPPNSDSMAVPSSDIMDSNLVSIVAPQQRPAHEPSEKKTPPLFNKQNYFVNPNSVATDQQKIRKHVYQLFL